MELVTGIHLFVLQWLLARINCDIEITFGCSECKGDTVVVSDQGKHSNDEINTTNNCTIKWNGKGTLHVEYNACEKDIKIFNSTGHFIKKICNSTFYANMHQNNYSQMFLNFTNGNSFTAQSRNSSKKVKVYISDPWNAERNLFSITCASAQRGTTTRNYEPTSTTVTDILKGTTEFSYIYAVAGGGIGVVVVLIIFVFFCIRRKPRARNTTKQEINKARTLDHATNGTKHPENVDSNEQRQLPDNPLYQSYQINDDGGYSTCRDENICHTEQLPDNPLYHSYQANGDKEDSKQNNGKDAGTLPLQESNDVYAQPNKLAKVSNSSQDDSDESQNENVYAQVNKTKET